MEWPRSTVAVEMDRVYGVPAKEMEDEHVLMLRFFLLAYQPLAAKLSRQSMMKHLVCCNFCWTPAQVVRLQDECLGLQTL